MGTQGLKPRFFVRLFGTTNVVPLIRSGFDDPCGSDAE
jgi:hypothetical protein